VKSPEIGEKYAGLGTLPRTMGADELNAYVKAEYAR
jgi:hypothetical protein